jgi:hypothetical protein
MLLGETGSFEVGAFCANAIDKLPKTVATTAAVVMIFMALILRVARP